MLDRKVFKLVTQVFIVKAVHMVPSNYATKQNKEKVEGFGS